MNLHKFQIALAESNRHIINIIAESSRRLPLPQNHSIFLLRSEFELQCFDVFGALMRHEFFRQLDPTFAVEIGAIFDRPKIAAFWAFEANLAATNGRCRVEHFAFSVLAARIWHAQVQLGITVGTSRGNYSQNVN